MNSRAQPDPVRDDTETGAQLQRENCKRSGAPIRERDVEAYLVKRVKQLGGEVRKVQWIGRSSAPDRVVMFPNKIITKPYIAGVADVSYPTAVPPIWIELKAPGKAASFPANTHERAQAREHERMRAMGQRVEVIDSFERVDEVLG